MRGRRAAAAPASAAAARARTPQGGFVELDGLPHYRIAACDGLEPFLVSLPSDTDLWMFIASGGGLTAGRVDPAGSLFPYVTVDELHDAHHHTGPVTLIRVGDGDGETHLWEPFGDRGDHAARERNLYKSVLGNRLVFEEIDHDRGLAFRYAWEACDAFGWVRTATLENRGAAPVALNLLDGLRNVLPFGAPLGLYQTAGNLVDAYKKSEVDPDSGLGIFALTAGITDRAEALEVLRANVVWCSGLPGHRVHLAPAAIEAFRRGRVLAADGELRGRRGNYLVSASVALEPGARVRWHLVGDTGVDHLGLAALRRRLRDGETLDAAIAAGLESARENLRRIVAAGDGLQLGAHPEATAHHFANVLFNVMRGGIFADNHAVARDDLAAFVADRNRTVAARRADFLAGLPSTLPVADLRAAAAATGDADLVRLCHEYLPLFFGRRHGDPSRPWNRFSIHVRDADGARRLYYEGNWRDIFQNWEALATSYPGFLPNLVAKFVNASTVDGHNPYRLTRDGVDWEVPAPDDPWSNIGYWGDHQIVYLLRLLELLRRHDPEALGAMLGADVFSYADVPYRIRPYAEIRANPRETITFDQAGAAAVAARVADRGADGRLVAGRDGAVRHVNLLEKLLVPALAKLSNLIPDAGIWLNTQRPEWNDANNALAGGGASVVTLAHLRRYLEFLGDLVAGPAAAGSALPVSTEVGAWFDRVAAVLVGEQELLTAYRLTPKDRKRVMDRLGEAFSAYREAVYADGLGRRGLAAAEVGAFCRTALAFIDRSLAANRRPDGLFDTYNLPTPTAGGDGVVVAHLQEMLEGQVAVLASGLLAPAEALDLLRTLFASRLFRRDQQSFMLYPERTLPGFLDRNVVPKAVAAAVPLVSDLLASDDHALVARDADGVVRFAADLANARDVTAALEELAADPRWSAAVARDKDAVLALYEDVFEHRAYTGRSGVMYAYEGLGCIYWHMVAKLLLAVQECVRRAERADAPRAVQEGLAAMYFRVRAGIGYEKPVAEYGAFPVDPYSHTPPGGGAKQPGMTGQVKEEILTRLGELGVRVREGAVHFRPTLLQERELLTSAADFAYVDVAGDERTVRVPAGGLAFTLAQVPVVYRRTDGQGRIRVAFADGDTREVAGDRLPTDLTAALFSRDGRLASVIVEIPGDLLGRLAATPD